MTVNDAKKLIDQAPAYEVSAEEIIQNLERLSPIEYSRVRKLKAKELNISVGVLDQEVKKLRSIISNKAEAELLDIFPTIEPWDASVNIDEVLTDISAIINRLAILPPHADTAITSWIAFTWCIDYMDTAPILALSSPEKRCGKTTVLSIIDKLVLRALSASNITPASLFRTIESWRPTLIIDEADTFIRKSDELRGIINSGHTRSTAYVIRTIGDDHTPKRFSTWSAKAIALIGKLPETLHDRSIVIELKRKHPEEKTEKMRDTDPQLFDNLKRKLLRFSRDNAEIIKNTRPSLPSGISDRAADNWEPLLAIAELAGAEWTGKTYQAAIFLSHQEKDSIAIGAQLLRDTQKIFQHNNAEKIPTQMLITALCKDEELPWNTYNNEKPITSKQVSSMLKQYGIQSKNIRLEPDNVLKGFERKQFEDAWNRYLPLIPSENAATPLQDSVTSNESNRLEEFLSADQSATNTDSIIVSATPTSEQNCASDESCSGVADNLEGIDENEDNANFCDEDQERAAIFEFDASDVVHSREQAEQFVKKDILK